MITMFHLHYTMISDLVALLSYLFVFLLFMGYVLLIFCVFNGESLPFVPCLAKIYLTLFFSFSLLYNMYEHVFNYELWLIFNNAYSILEGSDYFFANDNSEQSGGPNHFYQYAPYGAGENGGMETALLINSVALNKTSTSQYIPWNITTGMVSAQRVLSSMVDYAEESNKRLFMFLNEHCNHLLQLPTGHTNILKDFMAMDPNFPIKRVHLDLLHTPQGVQGGVYVLGFDHSDAHYTGSAIRLYTRILSHLDCESENSFLYNGIRANGGMDNLTVTLPYTFENYMSKYYSITKTSTVSPIELHILRTFTQYEARIYEQAILSYHNSSLNQTDVNFNFKWDPDNFKPLTGRTHHVTINALDTNNNVVSTYHSVSEASSHTGFVRQSVMRYINHHIYTYSPLLDQPIKLVSPDYSAKSGTLNNVNDTAKIPIIGFDRESLSPNVVGILDENKSLVGTFKNFKEAGKFLDIKQVATVTRFLNMNTATVGTLAGSIGYFYFVSHPLSSFHSTARKPVLLVDTRTNKYEWFDSGRQVEKKYPLRCINYTDKDKLYLDRYKLTTNADTTNMERVNTHDELFVLIRN